ncbi:MAG: protoporphyrinogen oxidase [Actinobacteria bacterium]|nr:protoporphyrinogen oxidase [Actinomycetota bacterium]
MVVSEVKRIVVVGAGVGGMVAAWEAQRAARELDLPIAITVLEQRDRVGGSIVTERVDGCLVEGGPDCFVSEKPWGLQLIRELGLADTLSTTNDDRRKTYVYWKGRLHPLPDGLILLVPTRVMPFITATLFSWPGKLRMALDLVLPRRIDGVDESLGDFIRRRLGSEALDKLGEPLVAGIHSGDPETMSVRATFPRFVDMEREDRSLILAMLKRMRAARAARARAATGAAKMTMFMTLTGGLSRLVEALTHDLGPEALVTSTHVERVERAATGTWTVHAQTGASWIADVVIVAAPAYAAAAMLGDTAPALADELKAIPYVSSATVTLAYDEATFPRDPDGFGVVIPKAQSRRIKALTWVTSKFYGRAPEGTILMRSFVRPNDESGNPLDERALIAAATEEIAHIVGVTAAPRWARAFRWDRAMPQYVVGHLARVDRIEAALASLPGLALAGGAYRGSGIPDTVRHSREQARAVVQALAATPD